MIAPITADVRAVDLIDNTAAPVERETTTLPRESAVALIKAAPPR